MLPQKCNNVILSSSERRELAAEGVIMSSFANKSVHCSKRKTPCKKNFNLTKERFSFLLGHLKDMLLACVHLLPLYRVEPHHSKLNFLLLYGLPSRIWEKGTFIRHKYLHFLFLALLSTWEKSLTFKTQETFFILAILTIWTLSTLFD